MLTAWQIRGLAVLATAVFVGAAFGIRLLIGSSVESTGLLEQSTGTALYAAAVYAGVIFLRPAMTPIRAGAIALAFCWLVEFSQLSGVPAELSERSVLARLVLGVSFDPADLAWYVASIVPVVAIHRWISN